MKKIQVLLIILASIATFFLVYSPHFNYRFPLHIDEWHQITEATKIDNGEYFIQGREGYVTRGFEIGFHIIIFMLLKSTNLVLSYQYLPALWAVVSALTLFYIVYKKTEKFELAFFSMIFFASIKSNVNIGGLWFFTPLTFSIPFIFLYVYFFTEGMEKRNKKLILTSILIMLFLLFIHAISVLFAIPFLLIYAFFHLDYIKKEYKFFLSFLLIPIIGIIFYIYMEHLSLINFFGKLIEDMQFKKGWGVLEIKNSFFELYSLTGYLLAIMGVIIAIFRKEKKFLAYILWPAALLISILIYRITEVSYLSSYQRNLYYFAISLPLLSSLGLYHILRFSRERINKTSLLKSASLIKNIITIILVIFVIFLAFKSYYVIPKQIEIYHVIDDKDYQALLFLSELKKDRVMADALFSSAVYPISKKEPVGATWFYGNATEVRDFFTADNCSIAQNILDRNNATYIISKRQLACDWKMIYKEPYIYQSD